MFYLVAILGMTHKWRTVRQDICFHSSFRKRTRHWRTATACYFLRDPPDHCATHACRNGEEVDAVSPSNVSVHKAEISLVDTGGGDKNVVGTLVTQGCCKSCVTDGRSEDSSTPPTRTLASRPSLPCVAQTFQTRGCLGLAVIIFPNVGGWTAYEPRS